MNVLHHMKRLMMALMLLVGSLAAASPAATASTLEAALARLAADSFLETQKAIDEIARSGSPRAQAVLDALADRRLLVGKSGRVAIKSATGNALLDAVTGAPVADPGDLSVARINNRLRAVIDAAVGSLTLLSPDRARRLQAAESILRSRDQKSLPALEQALLRESDPAVKAVMMTARAGLNLVAPGARLSDRLAAIEALAARGNRDSLALLVAARATLSEPEARSAAEQAIETIEGRQRVAAVVQTVWYGLSLGSVLLLAAIGLAITFGVMGVINMAHGEMVMIGAYTTFAVQETMRAHAPGALDWSLPIAIPLAFLIAAVIGIAIERGIIRFLYGRPLETLLATWGVSLFLQQLVRTIFGPSNREVSSPSYMSGSFEWMGLQIAYGRLWIIVFTILLFVGLLVALNRTPLGLQMRAVTQNRRMASSMGIRTPWIDAMTFGLGSGIAGIAGVALSQIDNVSPNLGQSYIIDSFMVVVFGGVGNLWGTLVSAFALGIANKIMEPLAGAVLAKIVILAALILFIQKRPRGLFALKGRAVEA